MELGRGVGELVVGLVLGGHDVVGLEQSALALLEHGDQGVDARPEARDLGGIDGDRVGELLLGEGALAAVVQQVVRLLLATPSPSGRGAGGRSGGRSPELCYDGAGRASVRGHTAPRCSAPADPVGGPEPGQHELHAAGAHRRVLRGVHLEGLAQWAAPA